MNSQYILRIRREKSEFLDFYVIRDSTLGTSATYLYLCAHTRLVVNKAEGLLENLTSLKMEEEKVIPYWKDYSVSLISFSPLLWL